MDGREFRRLKVQGMVGFIFRLKAQRGWGVGGERAVYGINSLGGGAKQKSITIEPPTNIQ